MMLLAEVSDAVWLALIAAIVTPLVNMIVGILMNLRMAANVQKIETATNSMKDALVDKTEKEARLRGGVEERARADQAAIIAQGTTKEIVTAVEEAVEKKLGE